MEYIQEDHHAEEFLPTDLVDENFAEEDDMNDGVPVQETENLPPEGEPGTDSDVNPVKDYSLNHSYRNDLLEFRRSIVAEIQRCKKKQEILSKRISDLEKQPVNPVPKRKNWYHLFGHPYFKDKHYFPCPINDDQRQKLTKNEIDYHKLPPIRRWTETDCLKLEEAVRSNAIEKNSSSLMRQRGLVLAKIKEPGLTVKEKKELIKEKIHIGNEIDKIKNMNPNILVGDKTADFDWLKITAEEFGELRSSEEVQAMWIYCRHPSINRKHWTQAENSALYDIAKRHKEQDWASIAAELNTSRTQFQCIVQYQRKLNTDFINHRWTDNEDEMLKYLFGRCTVNDYTPWSTIAMCMKNRTRQQVYNRWIYCLNPSIKKGRFTVEEDCLILAGVKHFGQDYAKIAELLPGRTTSQLNARYKMCLSRDGPLGQWSVEEDMRLLKLVEIHGKKWQWLTVEHFRSRSRSQIRHRYMYLEEWLSKNPDCSVAKAPRRDLGDSHRRNCNLWSTIQVALTASNKKRKRTKEINKEDIELLKITMASHETLKRSRGLGRKKKVFTAADKLLHQLAKVCYVLSAGRSKVLYSEEEFQKRENMALSILIGLRSHLAFPFDDSVIKNDTAWNLSDESILLKLKQKYDEGNSMSSSCEKSMANNNIITEGHGKANSLKLSTNGATRKCAGAPLFSSSVPLYDPRENISPSLPEIFPAFSGNVVGFRTVLLSRPNLKMWQTVPTEETVALPSMRPTSQTLRDEDMKCFSKEESAKMFSERLFSLFFWPTQLVRAPPDFDYNTFGQPSTSVENVSVNGKSPSQSKKRKRRTIKDQARSKKLYMKARWKKFYEEKGKNRPENGRSSSRSTARSKRKKTELEL